MISLNDKNVLITGGSRGIGAACVRLFHKAGANVFFTYKSDLVSANCLINEFNDNSPVAIQMDMESEQSIIDGVNSIRKKEHRIDILVNNAGIWKYGEIDKMSLEDWEETMRINMSGLFLVTREVVPVMKGNKFGRIINITSTAGQRGEAFHSHYAASKGAAISFTKSLAVELAAYNITVNSVAPGWVDTDMCTEVFSNIDYKEEVRKGIPVGRIATAEDIAGPVLFLASELARHINGEILNVNGGSVLCG
jgi:3-oxoacyl-[acyl-carrier protein] reductase